MNADSHPQRETHPEYMPSELQALDAHFFWRHGTVAPRAGGRAAAVDLPRMVCSRDAVLTASSQEAK